ncbi:MAG: TetR/AcrR family transcriptional regulator [Spirochaetia bacterium]|nr:TetR/AcrR family transcriptional regulator [Spirochaetia bacterium]
MKEYSDKQQQIISVSMTLVFEKGFSNLTIRNIAKEIGVTEPALYRHFSSKHEILVAIIETLQATILPHFSLLSEGQNSHTSLFYPFLTALFTTIQENPSFALFVFSEEAFHNDPALRPHLLHLLTQILSSIEKEFELIQNNPRWKKALSPKQEATITLSIIRFTVTKWHLSHGNTSLVDEIDPLSHLLHTLFF